MSARPNSFIIHCIFRAIVILCLLSSAKELSAQYTMDDTGIFDWQYIDPTEVVLGPDELSGPLPIGFEFTFFGVAYTTFYVSSNGFMTFDPSAGSGDAAQMIPDANDPNNLIAACWVGLPADFIYIEYETLGTAPHRSLHVSFIIYNFGNMDCDYGY